jgi:hypothetical protein
LYPDELCFYFGAMAVFTTNNFFYVTAGTHYFSSQLGQIIIDTHEKISAYRIGHGFLHKDIGGYSIDTLILVQDVKGSDFQSDFVIQKSFRD